MPNTEYLSAPVVWHAQELCVRFLSCCVAAFMADWEQQDSLCKSKVSVFLSLLSLAALHLQKCGIQLWKVRFATGVALPFQRDLSLISRGRSELRQKRQKWTHLFRRSFHPFKCHPIGPRLTKVVQYFFFLYHWLCVLECKCAYVCDCACTRSGLCVVSSQPWMQGRSSQLLPPACYHGDPIWESIIVSWQGWNPSVNVPREKEKACYCAILAIIFTFHILFLFLETNCRALDFRDIVDNLVKPLAGFAV